MVVEHQNLNETVVLRASYMLGMLLFLEINAASGT